MQDIQQIFPRSRVAAAVPEIWTDNMVDRLRKILLSVGYHNVYIVSEPKCCAVIVAHDCASSLRKTYTADRLRAATQEALDTIRIIFDLGAGTLDVCTTQIEAFEPKLKVKSIARASGCLWGSLQINEIFKARLRSIIGHSYDTIVQQLSGTADYNEDLLREPFVRGFEKAKREFDSNIKQDLVVTFDSVRRLPPVPGVAALRGGCLSLRIQEMENILEKYLEGMYRSISEQLDRLQAGDFVQAGVPLELHCVGGGSKSQYLRNDLRQKYKGRLTVMNHAKHDGSMVARGAMLMAVDPELGHHDFARAAFGSAYRIEYDHTRHRGAQIIPADDRYPYQQVDGRVFWGINVGMNTRNPPKPMVVEGYIEIPEDEVRWPIDPEMVLYKTEDYLTGNIDDVDVNLPGITRLPRPLSRDVEQHEQAFPFQTGPDGKRYLSIETRGIAMREGLRFYWIFVMHKTGTFPNKNLTEYNSDEYLFRSIELDDVLEYGALRGGSAKVSH